VVIGQFSQKREPSDRLATWQITHPHPDFTAVEGDRQDDFWITVVNAGIQTACLRTVTQDNEIVGLISLA
jgi:hypothetical protein